MAEAKGNYPEIIFLRRADSTGYGFFYQSSADYLHAADSFSRPVLMSFRGDPVPGQPEPAEHLNTAIQEFLGQAFDRTVSPEVGAEGISRAAAALARATFGTVAPRIAIIEKQKNGAVAINAALDYLRHPGFPRVIVFDADTHGGDARFFDSEPQYRAVGESAPSAQFWLTQVIFRLYAKTPSIMAGRPILDSATKRYSVECRGIDFGGDGALVERK